MQRDSEQQVFEKHCSSPFFYSSILHHTTFNPKFSTALDFKVWPYWSHLKGKEAVFHHAHCECDRHSKENCLLFLIVHSHFTKMSRDQPMSLPSCPLLSPPESTSFLAVTGRPEPGLPRGLGVTSVGNILRRFSAEADSWLHSKDVFFCYPMSVSSLNSQLSWFWGRWDSWYNAVEKNGI